MGLSYCIAWESIPAFILGASDSWPSVATLVGHVTAYPDVRVL